MSGRILFDSNAPIKFLDREPGFIDLSPFLKENDCFVSVITKLEILGWADITPSDEKRISEFLSGLTVLPLDAAVEEETIQIRRQTTLKLPDAIIAATAVVIDAEVVSTDSDFLKCKYPKLRVWTPKEALINSDFKKPQTPRTE
jgi:predicted nucleic acid-binding protein